MTKKEMWEKALKFHKKYNYCNDEPFFINPIEPYCDICGDKSDVFLSLPFKMDYITFYNEKQEAPQLLLMCKNCFCRGEYDGSITIKK